MIIFIIISLLPLSTASLESHFNFDARKWPYRTLSARLDGDIILGGLMMAHLRSEKMICGIISPQGGIQALESMIYTIKYINDIQLLGDLKLGAYINDDCDRDTYGLEQAVDFIKKSAKISMNQTWKLLESDNKLPVITGVVGAPSSVTSITVASLLKLFDIPQISFFSTSPVLSDKNRFPYFLRTIPSDAHQALVILKIVQLFQWKYVSVVYEDSSYGREAYKVIQRLFLENNICIAASETLPRDSKLASIKEYDEKVRRLKKHLTTFDGVGASCVVIFGSDQEVGDFMTAVRNNNLTDKFHWIGSDGWAGRELVYQASVHDSSQGGKEVEVSGAIAVQPMSLPIKGFQEYFLSLTPVNNNYNPWFSEFWEDYFECRLSNSRPTPFNNYKKVCSSDLRMRKSDKKFMLEDQLQFVSDSVMAFAIALKIDRRKLRFRKNSTAIPISSCTPKCQSDQRIKFHPGICSCWICIRCQKYDILNKLKTECLPCEMGQIPDKNKTGCINITQSYLEPNSPIALGILLFTSMGICCAATVVIIFIKFINSPIVRASSRELSFILLFGIMMCFVMTIILCTKPTDFNCSIEKFCIGLSFSVCYSALLVKTNRIERIFRRGRRTVKRLFCISPLSQISMCFLIVLIQIVILSLWLYMDPAKAIHHYPERIENQLICNFIKGSSFLIGLCHPMILILVCTVYVFLTRNIPEGYNESKHIGFAMYSTCVVWLGFIPCYFATAKLTHLRLATLCVSIDLSAMVTLFCLFGPKIYIILFKQELNTRQGMKPMMNSLRIGTKSSNYQSLTKSHESQYFNDSIVLKKENGSEKKPPILLAHKQTQTEKEIEIKIPRELVIKKLSNSHLQNLNKNEGISTVSRNFRNNLCSKTQCRTLYIYVDDNSFTEL